MNLLDRVSNPHELRRLSREELPQLADELRDEIVSAVSETGGCERCISSSCSRSFERNGSWPVSISNSKTPSA